MSRDYLQPWDAFLLADNQRERYRMLPENLRRSVKELIDAAIDLCEETYSEPFSVNEDANNRVQAAFSSPMGRRLRKDKSQYATHLNHTLPREIDELRTQMRQWLAGVEHAPRTAPRFGRRHTG